MRWLSAADADKMLGIPASTVRTWYHRRARTGLYPVSQDRRGRLRFRETDLIRLRDRRRLVVVHVNAAHGDLGRLLSASDAERVLGIPASTVNTWHNRRRLSPRGIDACRHPLFHEVDLVALKRGLRIRDDDGHRIYNMRNVGQ
jgi:transposase